MDTQIPPPEDIYDWDTEELHLRNNNMTALLLALQGHSDEKLLKKARKATKLQELIQLELKERQGVEDMFGLSPALILSESYMVKDT